MAKTKVCGKCGKRRSIDRFHWKKKREGIRRSWCSECVRVYFQRYYRQNREAQYKRIKKNRKEYIERDRLFVIQFLKDHPCVDCGEDDIRVLEFDHVRGKKRAPVGLMVAEGRSLAVVRKEIEKCQVRCANCHRRKTREDLGWYEKTFP